jgi:hypothetical protein
MLAFRLLPSGGRRVCGDIEKMHAAWVKSVLLQSILWGQPYVRDGEF